MGEKQLASRLCCQGNGFVVLRTLCLCCGDSCNYSDGDTHKKVWGTLSYDGRRSLSDAKQDKSDTAAVEYPETAHRFNFRVRGTFVCTTSTAFSPSKVLTPPHTDKGQLVK